MKKNLLYIFSIAALCITAAACGDKKTDGSESDTLMVDSLHHHETMMDTTAMSDTMHVIHDTVSSVVTEGSKATRDSAANYKKQVK